MTFESHRYHLSSGISRKRCDMGQPAIQHMCDIAPLLYTTKRCDMATCCIVHVWYSAPAIYHWKVWYYAILYIKATGKAVQIGLHSSPPQLNSSSSSSSDRMGSYTSASSSSPASSSSGPSASLAFLVSLMLSGLWTGGNRWYQAVAFRFRYTLRSLSSTPANDTTNSERRVFDVVHFQIGFEVAAQPALGGARHSRWHTGLKLHVQTIGNCLCK